MNHWKMIPREKESTSWLWKNLHCISIIFIALGPMASWFAVFKEVVVLWLNYMPLGSGRLHRICIFICQTHAWICCKNKMNIERENLLKLYLQCGVLFWLFELLLKRRSFSDAIQAISFQGRSLMNRLDCSSELLLKKFIQCDYGWCFLSQWFIIRYLDEACFSITDETRRIAYDVNELLFLKVYQLLSFLMCSKGRSLCLLNHPS